MFFLQPYTDVKVKHLRCYHMPYLTYSIYAQSFLQISYHGGGEGGESDDSEGENQELAQIDRGMCTLFTSFS